MSDTQSLKDFFAAWWTDDADGRAALVRSAISDDFHYLDPRTPDPISTAGAMLEYVSQFLNMCPPGARVEVAEPVDIQSGHARATVHFIMGPDKKQVGQYFADLDRDGKISRLVGFVGKGAE
ncbi:MAG: nuclear transport factor 2 family protein [Rhodobacter sp.]|nr:nuclear transport factor 2 family protein [Rhodobacter sp.]